MEFICKKFSFFNKNNIPQFDSYYETLLSHFQRTI